MFLVFPDDGFLSGAFWLVHYFSAVTTNKETRTNNKKQTTDNK